MNELNLDIVPKNLDEAVGLIVDALEPQEVEDMVSGKLSAISAHNGFGQWIRNNWSLWENDKPLVQWFRTQLHIGHADDLSGIILEAVVAKVSGEEYDPTVGIEKIHNHWKSMGCNEFGDDLSTW